MDEIRLFVKAGGANQADNRDTHTAFGLEDIDNNYSERVTLVGLRLEKVFTLGGRYRVIGTFDADNLFNSSSETNFFMRVGSTPPEHDRPRAVRGRRQVPVLRT